MYQLRNRDVKKAFKHVWSIDGMIFCRTADQAEKGAEARRRKEPEPRASVVNNPSDLIKLGWTKGEVEDIMSNRT